MIAVNTSAMPIVSRIVRAIDSGFEVASDSGIPAVLASHLQSLAGQLDAIDGPSGAAAVDLTVDLIAAAINDAAHKAEAAAQQKMREATAGMPLPPGMKLPF